MSLTYRDGLPIPPEEDDAPPRFGIERYVGLVDDEVAGGCSVLPMNATRGAALLPAAASRGWRCCPSGGAAASATG